MSAVGWRTSTSESGLFVLRRLISFGRGSVLNKSTVQVSEQGLRKVLYQKVSRSSVIPTYRDSFADRMPSRKDGCRPGRSHETVRFSRASCLSSALFSFVEL